MEELVWEVIILPDQLSELEQVLLVSNVNIAKEGLLVRVIAELEQMKEQQIQLDGDSKGCCSNTGRCVFVEYGNLKNCWKRK